MNNIKSFNEYTGQELERVAYDNVLNEKNILGGGLKGFFNRRAAGRVRAELAEEIEMSKSIMDSIKEGLESLNSNFEIIKKSIDDDKSVESRGEKKKTLDEIMKILEASRKNTWDLNQLIDEGEIDYTGFTANIGIASVAYFGILFTPFRAAVMIHKGYNYFFNIIKNTIRKALVMLQLNFDQFENLIITKGFQSMDYVQDIAASQKLDDTIDAILKELCGEKTGMIKSKSKSADYRKNIDIAYKRVKMENEKNKKLKQSSDVYNNLDPYNNTYTKSLETLRQYSQDDVQKHLDAIKNSMNKLAGPEADLQTYSELILAAAEEHAYKVSSSIYSKFAEMTEVFSLPNQKKLIDLIQAATAEEMEAAQKKVKDIETSKWKEDAEKTEEEGLKIFKSIDGVKIGDFDEETKKYKDIDAESFTYDKFNELSKEDQEVLKSWLYSHPEVLEKCDDTLAEVIDTIAGEAGYYEYIDSLIDFINPCVIDRGEKTGGKKKRVSESFILSFENYLFESKKKEEIEARHSELDKVIEKSIEEKSYDDLWNAIDYKVKDKNGKESNRRKSSILNDLKYVISKLNHMYSTVDGDEEKLISKFLNSLKYEKDEIEKSLTSRERKSSKSKSSEAKEDRSDETTKSESEEKSEEVSEEPELDKDENAEADEESQEDESDKTTESENDDETSSDDDEITGGTPSGRYVIDFSNLNDHQLTDIKKLYVKKLDNAKVALDYIGKKRLKSNTFCKNVESLIDDITDALKSKHKRIRISPVTYNLIKDGVSKLADLRNHDYNNTEDNTKKSED